MNIAERLKSQRKLNRLSQNELAELLGVSYMTIRRWEMKVSCPSAETMFKIAEVLHTSVEYLMGLKDDPHSLVTSQQINKENIISSLDYWGEVADNARKAAEKGKNLQNIISLLTDALNTLRTALANSTSQSEKYYNTIQKVVGI